MNKFIELYSKNLTYRKLYLANLVSRLGDMLEIVAITIFMYKLTNSALLTGLTMVISVIPNILFAPIAGALVDHYINYRLLCWTSIGRCILVLWVPIAIYLDIITFWQIYIIGFCVSIFETIFTSAHNTIIPLFIAEEDLGTAFSFLKSGTDSIQIIGLMLGGIIVSVLGPSISIILDSLSFFITALILINVFGKVKEIEKRDRNIFKESMEGLFYIKQISLLMILFFTGFIINITIVPINLYIPVILNENNVVSGFLSGLLFASAPTGMFIGSISFPYFEKSINDKNRFILSILFMLIGFVILYIYSFMYLYSIAFLIIGFAISISFITAMVKIQILTDRDFLGRVNALNTAVSLIGVPIAYLIAGTMIDFNGLKMWFLGSIILLSLTVIVLPFTNWRIIKETNNDENCNY